MSKFKIGDHVRVSLKGVAVATGTLTTSPWMFNNGVIIDDEIPLDKMAERIERINADYPDTSMAARYDATTYGNRKVIFAPLFTLESADSLY